MVSNEGTITKMAASPTEGLIDGTDAIHSGIINGLESFAYNRMIIEHAGFALSDGGSYTEFTLSQPIKYIFDGRMHTHTSNLSVLAGSGHNPDATHDRYHWVVLDYNDGGTPHIELITGTAAATPTVPNFNSDSLAKYIPVALVHYAAGSANDTDSRNFQMYTLHKNDLSLSVADDGASAGTIVEAMSITSSSGDVTFESKVSNQDIKFKVNDGGSSKELMRLDSSTPQVTIFSDGLSTALDIQSSSTGSGSGPDLALTRTGIADASGTPDGEQLGIIVFRGEDDGGSSTEYARVVAYVDDHTDGTEDGRLDIAVCANGSTLTRARFHSEYVNLYEPTGIYKDTDAEFIALTLKNQSDAADTSGKVSLRFDLEHTGGSTVDSGKILVEKNQSFTSTASTQDSTMKFYTSIDGTLTERARFDHTGTLSYGSFSLGGSDSGLPKVNTTTGTIAIGDDDCVFVQNCSSGTNILTLPAATPNGKVLAIYNVGTAAVALNAPSGDYLYSDTVVGGLAGGSTNYYPLARYQGCILISAGSNWYMMGRNAV